jgi:hypothetical protein
VRAHSGAVYSRPRREAIKNMTEIAAIFEPSAKNLPTAAAACRGSTGRLFAHGQPIPKQGFERHHMRIGQFVAERKNSISVAIYPLHSGDLKS